MRLLPSRYDATNTHGVQVFAGCLLRALLRGKPSVNLLAFQVIDIPAAEHAVNVLLREPEVAGSVVRLRAQNPRLR